MAGPRAWNTNMSFNFDKFAFFKDSRVRKAFSLAVDREEMIKLANKHKIAVVAV